MSKKKKINLKKLLLLISIILVTIFSLIFLSFTILYNKFELDIDKLTGLNNGIKVYSANGTDTSLYNTNRSIIEIETLPIYVINAFVDTEDKRFYNHNGYDFKRILKSGLVNILSNSKSQGASTISQQLIKNALLSNEKTYARKLKEVILSIKMEKLFSKEQILEMYLNTIYFGSNAYGIENASRTFFNKSAKELTLNEACCLAGIIKSPNNYSPISNPEKCLERKNLVAQLMLKNKHITQQEYDKLKNESLVISYNRTYDHSYEEEAIYEACKLLNLTEREIINKKLQIITYKDDDLQTEISNINNNILNSKNNSSLDSISFVINSNGHVTAYYCNSKYDLHNIKRQPASTLKPLAVYLPCIQHNILSPADVILDEEINYNGYSPKNADGKFNGFVSIKKAVADSLNIPAVKLLDSVGLKKSKQTLSDLGININNSDMNLSLALGSLKNGVDFLDLATAYSTIANMGIYKGYTFIDKILDANGKIIYQNENYEERVLNDDDCFLLTEMLKETAQTGTAKRLSELNLPIASKTGTASNGTLNTDLYNISYTTEHTIFTWIADVKNKVLDSSYHSSFEPTEIVKNICKHLYSTSKPKNFTKPENVNKYAYDIVELETTQKLVAPNQKNERYIAYDYFKDTNKPKELATNSNLAFDVMLDKSGATINFEAKRNQVYNIIRKDINGSKIICTVKDTSGKIEFKDMNIFSFNEISYSIESNNQIISKSYTIKPKDYLINELNNEILHNKKKWYV